MLFQAIGIPVFLPQGLSSHKPVGETFTRRLMAFSINLTAKYFTGVFPPLFLIIARKKESCPGCLFGLFGFMYEN